MRKWHTTPKNTCNSLIILLKLLCSSLSTRQWDAIIWTSFKISLKCCSGRWMKVVRSGRFRGTGGSVIKRIKSQLLFLDLLTWIGGEVVSVLILITINSGSHLPAHSRLSWGHCSTFCRPHRGPYIWTDTRGMQSGFEARFHLGWFALECLPIFVIAAREGTFDTDLAWMMS